jgi:polyferredoxin
MKKDDKFEILLTISTGLIIIYLFTHNKYLLDIIVCFNVLVLLIKPLSNLVAKAWMKLSKILGSLSSGILLSLIFYFFLTPIAFLARIFKGDSLKIRRNNKKSMFIERNYTYTSKDLEFPG